MMCSNTCCCVLLCLRLLELQMVSYNICKVAGSQGRVVSAVLFGCSVPYSCLTPRCKELDPCPKGLGNL